MLGALVAPAPFMYPRRLRTVQTFLCLLQCPFTTTSLNIYHPSSFSPVSSIAWPSPAQQFLNPTHSGRAPSSSAPSPFQSTPHWISSHSYPHPSFDWSFFWQLPRAKKREREEPAAATVKPLVTFWNSLRWSDPHCKMNNQQLLINPTTTQLTWPKF